MKAQTAFTKLKIHCKIAHFLGLFPCYFDNQLNLRPSKTWTLLLKICGVFSLCFVLVILAALNVILFQLDHTKYKWYNIFDTLGNISDGNTDIVALYAPYPVSIYACITIIYDSLTNWNKTLPLLEDYITSHLPYAAQQSMSIKPFYTFTFGSALLMYVTVFVFVVHISLISCEAVEVSKLFGIIIAIPLWATIILLVFPMAVGQNVFICQIINLKAWANSLTKKTDSSELNQYIKALKMANALCSRIIFVLVFTFTFCGISTLYRSISMVLGKYEMETNQIIVSATNGAFGASMMYWLFNMAEATESLLDKHQEIIDQVHEDQSWIQDLDLVNSVNQLEKFRGFSGLNFFTMNKSLLTSISANVVTYLIILIQFGSAEK